MTLAMTTRPQNTNPGTILHMYAGTAQVTGLTGTFTHEVLTTEDGTPVALVLGFSADHAEVLLFDETLSSDTLLYRSTSAFSVPVNDTVLGRVLDGFGAPQDGFGPLLGTPQSVFAAAPPMRARAQVTRPLTTGSKLIDTTLAVGRGQRQLIIGDRTLGKRTIAVDTILSQKHATPPVHCIYVVIGKKEATVRDTINLFEERNAFLYTTVVSAPAGAPLAAQYLAPFVGTTIAEHFRDSGRDALIVYDDLSRHAAVYRSMSLLLKRPPGREAYPGDIFALHSKLLERSAQLNAEQGGGSLTALPIAETLEGDISAFIPTNLISITDGQIYLERGLFRRGFLPAVNVGLSVSRVGSQAQPPALTSVVQGIRLALSQYKELQKLSQLETVVSEEAQARVHRGALILELLKQQKHTSVSWPEQVVLFYAVEHGFFDDLDEARWSHFETVLREFVKTRHMELLENIAAGHFSEDMKEVIHTTVDQFKQEFLLATQES